MPFMVLALRMPYRRSFEDAVPNLDAGSEVLRRAGSDVDASGSSEYLRTGVIGEPTILETSLKRHWFAQQVKS